MVKHYTPLLQRGYLHSKNRCCFLNIQSMQVEPGSELSTLTPCLIHLTCPNTQLESVLSQLSSPRISSHSLTLASNDFEVFYCICTLRYQQVPGVREEAQSWRMGCTGLLLLVFAPRGSGVVCPLVLARGWDLGEQPLSLSQKVQTASPHLGQLKRGSYIAFHIPG